MFLKLYSFISFSCIILTYISELEAQGGTTALYVFGDSLVDVGNNNYLKLSILKANYPHNGVDFPTGPTGRFSNGNNSADFIAEKLGLPNAVPYLSLSKSDSGYQAALIAGVSFASGGARILNGTYEELKQAISLSKQVEYYSIVYEAVVQQLGSDAAHQHFSKSLFLIVIGGNDLDNYKSQVTKTLDPHQLVDSMLSAISGVLKQLYGLGARKFAMIGIPAVGCIPKNRIESSDQVCDDNLNSWATNYNNGLISVLGTLKSELKDINYSYFDSYNALLNFIQNGTTYGFNEVKAACCGLGKLKAEVPCLPISTYCTNRSDHVFWDPYHPVEKIAALFVDMFFNGSHNSNGDGLPCIKSKDRHSFRPAKAEKVFTDIKKSDDPDSHTQFSNTHKSESPNSSKSNHEVKNPKWRPAPIKAKQDWHGRFKNIRIGKKGVQDILQETDNSTMAFALFDENLYPKEASHSNGLESCSPRENLSTLNKDVIPAAAVIKQLAVAIEAGKNVKTMKDLIASSTSSSPVRERASLSFSAMKSLVLREKDEKFASEFSTDAKALSLIKSLLDAEGHLPGTESGSGQEIVTSITSLPKEIHGAPPESFVLKLAEAVGSLKTLRKMAYLWYRVMAEVRRLWSEGQYIPGIPLDEIPDLNSCILYQQLQVINCCVSRKKRQSIAADSLDSVLSMQARIDGEESTAPQDALPPNAVFYARISTGELVLRLGADKQCDALTMLETGEPIYTPVTQEGPLLTEDLIKENEEFVLRTGSVGAGCSQLLSDMQAFKAANPGCILEDFVRWHSPPDWMEPEVSDESKETGTDSDVLSTKGQLSGRMQKEGNLWRELWETSKPVPAVKQSPLYDEDLAVEGILNAFEEIPPSQLFEQLFVCLLGLGFATAEATLASNSSFSKLFFECKDYIIAACQGKIWVEKIDDLCQVYETVELMLLNPDEVLNMTKNPDEGTTSGDQKSKFKRLALIFSGKDKQSRKAPKEEITNSEETPKKSFASMFLKKPPKPENASPAEKHVAD